MSTSSLLTFLKKMQAPNVLNLSLLKVYLPCSLVSLLISDMNCLSSLGHLVTIQVHTSQRMA